MWFSPCLLTQRCCTYACVVRTRLPPGPCAPERRHTPMHTRVNTPVHTRVNTAMRARSCARAEGMCCRSVSKHAGGDFLCLRKGFAFGLTLLLHFRKLKLEYPQKDEYTEHRILSCSSALNLTFLFFCSFVFF